MRVLVSCIFLADNRKKQQRGWAEKTGFLGFRQSAQRRLFLFSKLQQSAETGGEDGGA